MSELTLTVIRLGLLALLWVFVFSVVGVLRGDLYGTRVTTRASRRAARLGNAYTGTPAPPAAAAAPAVKQRRRGRGSRRVPTSVVLTEGPLAGTSMPLTDAGILIGRSPECTLVLDDDFASGRHARISRAPQGWVLEDLGSTNGTYAGPGAGERVTGPVALEVGSTIRIGQTVLELQ